MLNVIQFLIEVENHNKNTGLEKYGLFFKSIGTQYIGTK